MVGAVYTYAALKGMVLWKHSNFTVDVDGDRRELHGWSVVVANNQYYGGGMKFAPTADMEDGQTRGDAGEQMLQADLPHDVPEGVQG